jgi:hypothetical protein
MEPGSAGSRDEELSRMQNEDTRTAMTFAGLTAYETWMHYCNMGGFTDYFAFDAYLHGVCGLEPEDADLVSQAVNELIDDVTPSDEALLCRAPYSWTEDDENGCTVDRPFRIPVDDLARPHSLETFGSLFLAGLDVSTLRGRAGVPLPPGSPAELLGEILDSGIIGRIVERDRK